MNPILEQMQSLNRQPTQNSRQQSQSQGIANLMALKGNRTMVDRVFNNMMADNPQFREFVNANRGKSPKQIANDYGLNYSDILKIVN